MMRLVSRGNSKNIWFLSFHLFDIPACFVFFFTPKIVDCRSSKRKGRIEGLGAVALAFSS